MRILVVEDEKRLAGFIKKGLEEQYYAVDVVYDGQEGEYLALTNDYDLIILDLLLPKQDGWQTCENIRKAGLKIPIIILTALGEVTDRIRGLDHGADDYITKPFEIGELLARIRAHLRRRYSFDVMTLEAGGIQLDTRTRQANKNGETIELTNKEFALLEYLLINKNRVVPRTRIAEHVWAYFYFIDSDSLFWTSRDVGKNFLFTPRELGEKSYFGDVRDSKGASYKQYTQIFDENPNFAYEVDIAIPCDYVQRSIALAGIAIGSGAVLIILVAGFGGLLLKRRALAPVNNVIERVNELSSRDIDKRIPVENVDAEIARLISTFNHLLDRLAADFKQQKSFEKQGRALWNYQSANTNRRG
jgi:DNA-binding response OmpR family regulator/HAMP domain-containing protein